MSRMLCALALASCAFASLAADAREAFMARLAQEAGLPPLADGELRLWSFSFHTAKNFLIRLHETPRGVRGELTLWWSREFAPNPDWRPRNLRCARQVTRPQMSLCRAVLSPAPDWPALLGDLAAYDVWSLPDGRHLEPQRPIAATLDSSDLAVELRRGGKRRAYFYNSPERTDALAAERILARSWSFVHQHVRGYR